MTSATFKLSAFGDEIAKALEDQLKVLRELGVGYLELRSAWGKNVLAFEPEDVERVKEICAAYGIAVSCIGSPIGKSPLQAPIEEEEANLARVFRIAEALDTRRIRIFSFYPPDTSTNAHYDQHLDEAIDRLRRLTVLAEREGFQLLLENEKAIVGDTPERCYAILRAIDRPALRFLWDPANFIQVGVEKPIDQGWALLGPYTTYVHIKDASLADKQVRLAGEGDGQIPELLTLLRDQGYQGFLALEPHLMIKGRPGMPEAVAALRRLMAQLGCDESH